MGFESESRPGAFCRDGLRVGDETTRFYEIHGRSGRHRSGPPTLCRVAKLISGVPRNFRERQPCPLYQGVRPLIGTGWHGHTFPGATRPSGLVHLSPDTQGPPQAWYGWDRSGGYAK